MGRDRRAAVAAERGQKGAFGRDRPVRRVMIDRRHERQGRGIVAPALDADGPLRRGGEQDLDRLNEADIGHGEAFQPCRGEQRRIDRSEEHTSELQSLMRISYAVFCLTKKKKTSLNKTL